MWILLELKDAVPVAGVPKENIHKQKVTDTRAEKGKLMIKTKWLLII